MTNASLPRPSHRINVGEVTAAIVVAAVGIYMVSTAHTIANIGNDQVGPRVFPYLVGGLLVITGIGIAISAMRGFHAEPEGGEDIDASASTDWKTLLLIASIFVAYIVLIQPIGYLLMTMFLFGSIAWTLGAKRWRGLLLTTVLVPFISYLFFTRVLGIYIPNGILEAVI